MKKNTLFPIILVLLVLGGLGLSQLNNSNKPSTPPRPEIPKENQNKNGGCQHPVHKKSAEATERHKHEG